MTRTTNTGAPDRAALRRRLKRFYVLFDRQDWNSCFNLIDPTLQGKVEHAHYAELMQRFKDAYGVVKLRWTHVSLHLTPSPKQRDQRPFAYVYVVWQDAANGFHLFRERWIKDDGRWFTRVVGLVPNRQQAGGGESD